MKLNTQVFVGTEKPEPDKISLLSDDLFWKPCGGLWTSTLDDEGGDWVRWLHDQGYSLDMPRWGGDLWVLKPTDANVLVIDNPGIYNDLAERFPHRMTGLKGIHAFERLVAWPDVAEQ